MTWVTISYGTATYIEIYKQTVEKQAYYWYFRLCIMLRKQYKLRKNILGGRKEPISL